MITVFVQLGNISLNVSVSLLCESCVVNSLLMLAELIAQSIAGGGSSNCTKASSVPGG